MMSRMKLLQVQFSFWHPLLYTAVTSMKNRLHDCITCFDHFYQDVAFSNVYTWEKQTKLLEGRVKAFQPSWQSKRP